MKKLFYFTLLIFIPMLNQVTLATDFTPEQVAQIEKITHNYIVKNPKVLVEAGKSLHEQDREAQKQKIRSNIANHKTRIFDVKASGRIVRGNPQGKIIIAEFTQHQCSHCKEAAGVVDKLIKNHPEIQFISIYWPFFGGDAIYAAKAVLAAKQQGKAEELDRSFFAHKELLNKAAIDTIIKTIPGLDSKKLLADMNSKELESCLKDNYKLAQDLGINGTPDFALTNQGMTKFSLPSGKTPNLEEDLVKALAEVS